MMMTLKKGQIASTDYDKYVDEFIGKFPASAYGYKERASRLSNEAKYEESSKLMEECIKKAAKKDEAYSAYADIIYQKAVYKGDSIYTAWNIDKAIEMIRKAYSINALPAYKHQEAQYSYFKGDYQQAVKYLNDYGIEKAQQMLTRWKQLFQFMVVKYNDMIIKPTDKDGNFVRTKEGLGARPVRPGYPEKYAKELIKQTGDKFVEK